VTLLALSRVGVGSLPVDEPALYADDEGFLRGRAVFETIRVYAGRPFRLPEHLERLARSAQLVGIPEPDSEGLSTAAEGAVSSAGVPDAVLRLLWTPGREGLAAPAGFALVSTLPPNLDDLRTRGLRLASVDWATGRRLGSAKSTSYAENFAAVHEALAAGSDDALLVGRDGVVLETPTANVWWRRGADVYTPALELPILAGVTGSVVWNLAERNGYTPHEAASTLSEVQTADEIFLTASIREVMPVTTLDGLPVGDGSPGEAAQLLQRALRSLV